MKTPSSLATRSRRQLAGAVLALLAGAAIVPTQALAHARGQDPAAMQQRYDQHLATLKQSLQLTPAQEAAWNQFASAMRPAATAPAHPDRAALEKMTTPQRMEQMQAMRKQHQAEMDKREAAVKTFYATLTPEQQKRFDAEAGRMMGGGKGSRGGHHGRGGEGHGPQHRGSHGHHG